MRAVKAVDDMDETEEEDNDSYAPRTRSRRSTKIRPEDEAFEDSDDERAKTIGTRKRRKKTMIRTERRKTTIGWRGSGGGRRATRERRGEAAYESPAASSEKRRRRLGPGDGTPRVRRAAAGHAKIPRSMAASRQGQACALCRTGRLFGLGVLLVLLSLANRHQQVARETARNMQIAISSSTEA